MLQSGEIKEVLPVDSAFVGSTISIPDLSDIVIESPVFSRSTIGLFILFILIIFFLFERNIVALFPKLFSSLFYKRDALKIIETPLFALGQVVIFILCCLILVSLFIRYEHFSGIIFSSLSPGLNFLIIIFIIYAIFLFRKLILLIIPTVTGYKELFSITASLSLTFFILFTLISSLPLPFTFFVNNINFIAIHLFEYVVFGVIFLFYLISLYRLFISFHVSQFFTFLYLCTLEILPVAILIATMALL